jgi:hypothetical protein
MSLGPPACSACSCPSMQACTSLMPLLGPSSPLPSYVHLKGVLSAAEVDQIEQQYMKILNREVVDPAKLGKDFCDMSGDYNRPLESFNIVNVMMPTRYYPPLAGNTYERRSASIAEQLHGPDMVRHTRTHTHTFTHSLTHSLSLSHTHTHTLSHTHIHT